MENNRELLNMEEAIKSLMELGFSEDEASVYCVLLEDSPLSGYEVARRTGIARAHIYEILESLYRKGCVTISYSTSPEYAALPYEQMLTNYIQAAEENRKEAVRFVEQYTKERSRYDVIQNIYHPQDIYNALSQLIADTQDYILMKIWAKDLAALEAPLSDAAARGVDLKIIVLGPYETLRFPFFSYASLSEQEDGTPYRKISAAFGSRVVLCGNLSDTQDSFCASTRNYCLVVPVYAELLYELDLMELYQQDQDGKLTQQFGEDLILLRRKYL